MRMSFWDENHLKNTLQTLVYYCQFSQEDRIISVNYFFKLLFLPKAKYSKELDTLFPLKKSLFNFSVVVSVLNSLSLY